MTAERVLIVLHRLETNGVSVHVDGGWGVDALLGEQTRPHGDLDVAVPHHHVPLLRSLLTNLGFVDSPRPDSWDCNFVLEDAAHDCVDVHSYVLDGSGGNAGGIGYRAEHLAGQGTIGGVTVRCVSPEALVQFHTGYRPDANDRRDVRRICERFGIPLPASYREEPDWPSPAPDRGT